jgi:predicted nucleic acid-binding Zn ribbon protein
VTRRTIRRSEGQPARRSDGPTRLGDALKSYAAKAGLARRLDLAQIVEEWPKLVGPQIAAVTRADSVTPDGILRVRVVSSAWANELSLMMPKIMAKLNAGRRGRIRELRYITGPLDR